MGRPDDADVQWFQWFRQIGALAAFQEGRLTAPFLRWTGPSYAHCIMDRCIQVPAAYWPQLVDEECEKLLAVGLDGEAVERVRRWLERELTLSVVTIIDAWPFEIVDGVR